MTVSKVIIRKGKVFDIPQLIKLYAGVKEISDFTGQRYDRAYFILFIKSKDNIVLVAEKDRKIIGAVNAEFEDLAKYTFSNNTVVSKKYRGQGIGGLLMRALESISKKRKIKQILGLVYDWNKNTQKIMEHYGYVRSGKMILYSKKL